MATTRAYNRHYPSGEIYVLEYNSDGIVDCVGPLHYTEVQDPYGHDPGDPADADWAAGEAWRALDWPSPHAR